MCKLLYLVGSVPGGALDKCILQEPLLCYEGSDLYAGKLLARSVEHDTSREDSDPDWGT